MSDAYKTLAEFAQTWGIFYFLALFAVAVAYAFWPGKREQWSTPPPPSTNIDIFALRSRDRSPSDTPVPVSS